MAVLAGGCASATVDVAIYPLDTLKTRLQAPQGFHRAGGMGGLFRGVVPAALGAVPGGAVFFGAYEYTRQLAQGNAASPHWTHDAFAATVAATASCLVRNPAFVVTQRMQVGQFSALPAAVNGVWVAEGAGGFYAGLWVSVLRELPFAFIQFPMYESLKRLVRTTQDEDISASQGALCGSIAGAAAAAATTPLDLIKTRFMLGGLSGEQRTEGVLAALRRVAATEGTLALFSGIGPRVGWMTLGGYIFFGAYEQCLRVLMLMRDEQRQQELMERRQQQLLQEQQLEQQLEQQQQMQTDGSAVEGEAAAATPEPSPELVAAPSSSVAATAVATSPPPRATSEAVEPTAVRPTVALVSGAMAGMSTDLLLFPIDTLKTRAIQGHAPLFSSTKAVVCWRAQLQGVLRLWRGIGAAIAPAVPAAASFFVTYESVKSSEVARGALGENTAALSSVSALVAEAVSCVVRVPAEQLKMRLQATSDATISAAARSVFAQGGWSALYKGLGATLLLDLPFALIQFPLFESLKAQLARRRLAEDPSTSADPTPTEGAMAGAMAGACAALLTTPLDVIRTRHVLSAERRHMLSTVRAIHAADGVRGFFRGLLPRTLYMGAGGVVYLGMYTVCCTHFGRLL